MRKKLIGKDITEAMKKKKINHEQLKLFLQKNEISQIALAELFNKSRHVILRMVNGKQEIPLELAIAIRCLRDEIKKQKKMERGK